MVFAKLILCCLGGIVGTAMRISPTYRLAFGGYKLFCIEVTFIDQKDI